MASGRGELSVTGDLEWRKRVEREFWAERDWTRDWGWTKVKPEDVFGEGSTFTPTRGRPLGPPPAAIVPPEDPDAPKGFEFEAAKTRDKLEQARLRKLERDVSFRLQARQMLEEQKAAAAAARNKTKAQLQKEEEEMFMTVFARKHKMHDIKDPNEVYEFKHTTQHDIGWRPKSKQVRVLEMSMAAGKQ